MLYPGMIGLPVLDEIGFTYDGAHAELVAVKAKYCWPIAALVARLGAGRGYAAGALVEPTSVAYIGMLVQARGLLPGASVGVVGAGPIGLAAVGLARAADRLRERARRLDRALRLRRVRARDRADGGGTARHVADRHRVGRARAGGRPARRARRPRRRQGARRPVTGPVRWGILSTAR